MDLDPEISDHGAQTVRVYSADDVTIVERNGKTTIVPCDEQPDERADAPPSPS